MLNIANSRIAAQVRAECKLALDSASSNLTRANIEWQLSNAALQAVRRSHHRRLSDMDSAVHNFSAAGNKRDEAQCTYDIALARHDAAQEL